jgi:hypothetical protein
MYSKLGASEKVAPIQKQNIKKRGRPLTNKLINTPTKDKEVYISKTVHTIESAENKIKSLETIMNLFTNGVINNEELQSLKVGILNK